MEREYKNSDGKVVSIVPYMMKAKEYEIAPVYGGGSDYPIAFTHPKTIEEKHLPIIHVIKQIHRDDYFNIDISISNSYFHRFTPTEIVKTKI